MAIETEKSAPYAPAGNVLSIIRRLRERSLPEILTQQELTRVGIAEGNASRVLRTLHFLGLIDEEGRRTQMFDRLGRAPSSEYPELLGQILKDAYSDVFTIVDPADATDIEINDAFRHYEPQAQRSRMISLFKGLCQEAEIMAGEPPEISNRRRALVPNKLSTPGHSKSPSKPQPKIDLPMSSPAEPAEVLYKERSGNQGQEYVLLQGVLGQLPLAKRKWTQARRNRWIQAITANVDLLIDVVDSDEDTYI